MPEPSEAPPSYDAVVGSTNSKPSKSTHLEVPKARNGIPALRRRSMEDELRKTPPGWIRQWDDKEQHQFFVDTKATPPRSIWHHPYDDDEYLSSLSSEERERIQEEEQNLKKPHGHHLDTTDEEGDHHHTTAPLPPRPTDSKDQKKGLSGFGRKMKDKVTGSTHEERQAERAQREEEERKYYEMHQKFRQAMATAQATGQPQFFAKDKDGKDIYVEPPQNYGGRYNGAYGGGGGYGYSPYQTGLYGNPNARYIRPQVPYGRPYGYGYGGGMGMPLLGGMMGGMMLGGLLF